MRNKNLMKKVIFLLMITLLIPPTIANASNHKPSLAQIEAAKKAEAAKQKAAADALKKLEKARGNLRALTAIAKAAESKYLAARGELARATAKADAATKDYDQAVAKVAFTRREIGKLAVHAYITGGSLTDLEVVLNASGPQELIDRISTLDNLSETNKTALSRFKSAEEAAQKAKEIADAAKEEKRIVTIRVADAKKEADDARAEQQKEVDKLQAVQDKLQKDLASAKKVRITLEFAKRQVLANKPYVWGDEGPNTFDCSGLVYAAYKSAGLGWPIWDRLNSGLYYTYTKQIPLSEMEPGDLLFYSYKGTISTIHHMSIYAGDGMMWEARSTKSGLRYSNIYSMPGMMPYAGRV